MTEQAIQLTLNGETREVNAESWGDFFIAYNIQLVTTSGNKAHSGYVFLKKNEQNVYTARDITEIGYSGMRGNGGGARSRFRHIGFFAA